MFAFTPITPVTVTKATIGNTTFATPLAGRPTRESNAPTMVFRNMLTKPVGTGVAQSYAGVAVLLQKADDYMGTCIRRQYIQMTNPTGIFSVQCTEGAVSGAAEVTRVRVLGSEFRTSQSSAFKVAFDKFENRKNAISKSHGCHHEESQFVDYGSVSSSYNVGQSEALGSCFRYASPETVEEAAMLRYMDIQHKIDVNPTGVYNTSCNEGTVKGQAEDIRVAALNTAFRQGQKSILKIMDEKYQQKKNGYAHSHGCNYEEGLVSNYPSLGACFRSKSYGY